MPNYLEDELEDENPVVDDSSDSVKPDIATARPTGLASVFPGLSLSDLKSQSDDASRNKKILTTAGSILQGFENVPTAYELLSGKRVEKPDVAGSLNQIASNIQDPWEKQKKTYEAYKGMSDANQLKEMNDPNSERSKRLQDTLRAVSPAIAEKLGDGVNKIPASQMPDIIKQADAKAKLDQVKAISDNRIDAARARNEDLRFRQQMMADQKREAADDRNSKDYDKYVQHIEDTAKGWRSDPASMRFDSMIGAAKAGKAIIDRYRGHEDDMPIQDIHSLVVDKLKAQSGAAPTVQDVEAQMPHTAGTKWAGIKSFITGTPSGANAGDFVKNFDESFKEMEKTAMDGLVHRQKTIASNPRLKPEDRERIEKIGVPESGYNHIEQKNPVKKEFNAGQNKTRITYSDGSTEIVDGRQ